MSSFLHPAALMRIKSLELRARVVVEGMWKGMHRSPYHGFSVEFSEYRAYVKGDDPRHIDWKVLARSDRTYIKKFEDETNLRCQLVIDHSRSMQFGPSGYTKSEYASTLAATLACFLMKQGDAVGLTTFGEKLEEHIPARNRPGHLRRLLTELEKPAVSGGTSLEVPVRQLADLLTKRGLIVFISDLLAPLELLDRQLGWLGAMGHDVVLFQVMDRAEIDFKFDRAAQFLDMESGDAWFVNPAEARDEYLKKFNAHRDAARSSCERHGVEYQWLPTDTPLEQALFDFLSVRNHRKGGATRRVASSAGISSSSGA
jgi:uncharacterized protein (DUF58 family)